MEKRESKKERKREKKSPTYKKSFNDVLKPKSLIALFNVTELVIRTTMSCEGFIRCTIASYKPRRNPLSPLRSKLTETHCPINQITLRFTTLYCGAWLRNSAISVP